MGEKAPPVVKKWWTDKGGLSDDRVKEVGAALGGKGWPPSEGSLLAHLCKVLEVFIEELPKQTVKAVKGEKEQREQWAKEDAEEEEAGGGVRIEPADNTD